MSPWKGNPSEGSLLCGLTNLLGQLTPVLLLLVMVLATVVTGLDKDPPPLSRLCPNGVYKLYPDTEEVLGALREVRGPSILHLRLQDVGVVLLLPPPPPPPKPVPKAWWLEVLLQ
jgi:hypothetical protein